MSLKNSERNNCSWRINTVLVCFLFFFSSCHAFLPLAVRPMRAIQEIFLKIFFISPELKCSIIFSMHTLSMTKKTNQLLRYFKFGEWIFPRFNTGPSSFPSRNCTRERAGRFSSLWFCFSLRSACENFCTQFLNHILRADLREFLFHCCSNSSQTYLIHEKSWPRSECCLCFNSMFTVQIAGCNFQYGPNFGVPLYAPFRLWCCFFSCSRQATVLNCVRSPVSFVMKYCPFSTSLRNPASIQNLLNLSCCDNFSIRSS